MSGYILGQEKVALFFTYKSLKLLLFLLFNIIWPSTKSLMNMLCFSTVTALSKFS